MWLQRRSTTYPSVGAVYKSVRVIMLKGTGDSLLIDGKLFPALKVSYPFFYVIMRRNCKMRNEVKRGFIVYK